MGPILTRGDFSEFTLKIIWRLNILLEFKNSAEKQSCTRSGWMDVITECLEYKMNNSMLGKGNGFAGSSDPPEDLQILVHDLL
jgi:hypothetical protein